MSRLIIWYFWLFKTLDCLKIYLFVYLFIISDFTALHAKCFGAWIVTGPTICIWFCFQVIFITFDSPVILYFAYTLMYCQKTNF